jgi:hypothetical protein
MTEKHYKHASAILYTDTIIIMTLFLDDIDWHFIISWITTCNIIVSMNKLYSKAFERILTSLSASEIKPTNVQTIL